MRRRLLPLACTLLFACGYFNAMYNARRSFGDAERAAAQGEREVAARAYMDAIEKAAASYRGHPDGRWADDALYLIGRARFALGEDDAAHAAFSALLAMQPQGELRWGALAWLGATGTRRGQPAEALAQLDTALANVDGGSDVAAFARLWRARARFDLGELAAAWDDLDAARLHDDDAAFQADLETASRALQLGDSARFRAGTTRLLRDADAAPLVDSIARLADAGTTRWGAGWMHSVLAAVEGGAWPTAAREERMLARAGLAAQAGDTVAAIDEALAVARRAAPGPAAAARRLAARLELARVDSFPGLARVRAILLPSLDDVQIRNTVRSIRTVEVLIERAVEADQPLALFAAAEIARDELQAPRLARQLFLEYARFVPEAVWAPKALLAAAALSTTSASHQEVMARLHERKSNVYVQAMSGDEDAEAWTNAEDRLGRTLTTLRSDARIAADSRDIGVGSAIARFDSLRARVVADSMRSVCGHLIDSLAIRGVRADSVRAACQRRDSTAVDRFMKIDTLMLRDTTFTNIGAAGAALQDAFAAGRR